MRRRRTPKSTRSDGPASAWMLALAKEVRAKRKALGLTQQELARLAGCGPVFLYAVERGKATVRVDKLLDVLRVLGLTLLLRGVDG